MKTFKVKIFNKRFNLETLLLGIPALIVTVLLIFTPDTYFFKQICKYTSWFTIVVFAASILALFLNRERLMYLLLFCTVLLSAHMRKSYGTALEKPIIKSGEATYTIANILLDNTEGDISSVLYTIDSLKPDVVTFTDVNPYWNDQLKIMIEKGYTNQVIINRFDFYGMAVFSKSPMVKKDTLMFGEIPNIYVVIKDSLKHEMGILLSVTNPIVNTASYRNLNDHLEHVAEYSLKNNARSMISLGKYNIVPYSQEIQNFKEKSHLELSSRAYLPSVGRSDLFYTPVDHIFYSQDLDCSSLISLRSVDQKHIGLMGTYFKKNAN